MRYENVVIPLRAAWSSPFARWQGPTADVNSLVLAEQVTARALAERGVQRPVEELVLGWTVPQKEAFCASSVPCADAAHAASRPARPAGARGARRAATSERRRRRARSRVEDHIRNDKDTGLRNLPFRDFEHNRVWLQLVLIAHDLIAWTQVTMR